MNQMLEIQKNYADKILVLEDGRVVEEGTRKELMENRGAYWEIYQTQGLLYVIRSSLEITTVLLKRSEKQSWIIFASLWKGFKNIYRYDWRQTIHKDYDDYF